MLAASPPQNRVALYLAAVFGFAALMGVATVAGSSVNQRGLYLCALFAACASPILYVDRLNGPYTMLCAFLAVYFVTFGAQDLLSMLVSVPASGATAVVSLAEIAIVVAVVLIIAGYRAAVASVSGRGSVAHVKDWSMTTLVVAGFGVWSLGVISTWIWQIEVLKRAWDPIHGLGPYATMMLIAGRMIHPLGLGLLAYGFVTSRNRLFGMLMLGIVIAEFILGFIEDSKEIAIQGAVVLLVAKYLIEGRIPKLWLAVAATVAIISFPVFQAYRTDVLLERGVSRSNAAESLGKNLDIALHSNAARTGEVEYGSLSFLSRISYKGIIETVIDRTGNVAPYQNGYTIGLFFSGFVPRLFWPDKPDLSVGQLFNRQLHITESGENYVSTTMLGDIYWNFGWLGILFGSALFGYFIGTINRRCDLSECRSVTRFLIFSVSTYSFCLRFEDSIAMGFTVWVRTIAAVAVLHLLFARPMKANTAPAEPLGPLPNRIDSDGVIPFPNLMR
ncbi:MAG TPA: hypothetical protein VGD63_15820 [Steroidobacteraceae bacterium]